MKKIWSDIKFYGYKLIYGTYFTSNPQLRAYMIQKRK